jgi:hypothetical protein
VLLQSGAAGELGVHVDDGAVFLPDSPRHTPMALQLSESASNGIADAE